MRNWKAVAATAAAVSFLATACGGGSGGGDGQGAGGLSGTVRLDGSSTVGPLSEAAAELFMKENPGVQVTVGISGTGGGFEKFCNGETDGNDASREIKDEEKAACEKNNIKYDNVQVANDALSIVVNPENPLECITVDQAKQIWDKDSKVKMWGDVEGLEAGPLATGEIKLYGPGSDSGTFDFFTEAVNGEEGRIRTDYTDIGEDDQAAITGVEGDKGAMAFIPYTFVQEAGEKAKPLKVDDGSGNCVEATEENVQSGTYVPLGRPLFVYASDKALEKKETIAFLKFYLDNSDEIAEAVNAVALTEDQASEGHKKIDELSK